MSRDEIRNVGQSIYQRLLNLSRAEKVDFNLILTRYGIERLLSENQNHMYFLATSMTL